MEYDYENEYYFGYDSMLDEYQEEYEDDLLQRHLDELAEEEAFKKVPKHGCHAPAYKKEIDNMKLLELWRKNYSLRRIAKALGCSVGTVHNRLKKLNLNK